MRENFMPSFYTIDLYRKLQRLYQGSKSVEEYFKEMKVTLIRVQVVESQEATMARFLNVHQATKVELQLKRHGKKSYPSPSSNWKGKERTEESKIHITSQCPNKRTMVLRENGEMESESSREDSFTNESESSSSEAYYQGDLFMARRLMSILVENDQSQKENIFYSRCLVQGSSVNVASLRLVKKLAIFTSPHLKPYKLHWLSKKGEMIIDRRVFDHNLGNQPDTIITTCKNQIIKVPLAKPW
ncbi:hypothetical protein CR513_50108, partial [Mucuna pruriens]